ncbi:hypothetical protein [Plebeiibacterium sediminum]|uniref:YD repeat-containing protein n=1 Tax=Plebeiibacterium sediminum TaxID=2992112 RepID=A0AAE3SH32_9BACT|nr:hypothetical protein [Plebeiobacterium sediminum]MCW3787893.1 hypothetical protein [Plebeiobacterium sediminum]
MLILKNNFFSDKLAIQKMVIVFILLFCVYNYGYSQNVDIGTMNSMAQNNIGNTSVNPSTGILNYSIPLINISQDGYSFPISLSYSTTGIKVSQNPGNAGLGWYLSQTPGVITRTIRGGYADEDTKGIWRLPIEKMPLQWGSTISQVQKSIVQGDRDSENDIFTLNINGQQVHFIINQGEVATIEASDIDIQFDRSTLQFTVIDVSGIVYYFSTQESSKLLILKGGAANSKYYRAPLSWYLERVSIPNGEDINFEWGNSYDEKVNGPSIETQVNYSTPNTKYNLDNYEIRSQIEKLQAGQKDLEESFEQSTKLWDQQLQWNYKFMTIGCDPSDTSSFKKEYNHLKELYKQEIYSAQLAIGANEDVTYWEMAALDSRINEYVKQLYATSKSVDKEMFYSGQMSYVPHRKLKKIITRNQVIEFDYTELVLEVNKLLEKKYRYVLKNISCINDIGIVNKKIHFAYNDNKTLLKRLDILGDGNKVQDQLSFNYYRGGGSSIGYDYWGYYNGSQIFQSALPRELNIHINSENNAYQGIHPFIFETANNLLPGGNVNPDGNEYGDRVINEDSCKVRSLQSIENLKGGKISFEYESNQVFSHVIGLKAFKTGGLRIKSYSVSDGKSKNTVSYLYEDEDGMPSGRIAEPYTKCFKYPYITDQGVDMYLYSNFIDLSIAPFDKTNNGVLYDAVKEIRDDRSYTQYIYLGITPEPYLPEIYSNPLDPQRFIGYYPYLDNLLLEKCYVDAEGKIVSKENYSYYTNIKDFGNRTPYKEIANVEFLDSDYSDIVLVDQIKKGPVSMNERALKNMYKDENQLAFIESRYDGSGKIYHFMNTYKDLYIPNYSHKLIPKYPPINYTLQTNVLILPAKTTITTYDSNGNGLEQTEAMFYDNKAHLFPTRIVKEDSKGDITVCKKKYVVDYNLQDSDVISKLQSLNCNNYLVEEQIWSSKNKGTSYSLLSGFINKYGKTLVKGKYNYYLEQKYQLELQNPLTTNLDHELPSYPYTKVFWDNNSLYKSPIYTNLVEEGIGFIYNSGKIGRNGEPLNALKLDLKNGNVLLKANNVFPDNIVAQDYSPEQSHPFYSKYGIFTKPQDDVFEGQSSIFIPYTLYPWSTNKIYPDLLPYFDHRRYANEILSLFNLIKTTDIVGFNQMMNNTNYSLFSILFNFFKIIAGDSNQQELNRCIWEYNKLMRSNNLDFDPSFMQIKSENEYSVFTFLQSHNVNIFELKAYISAMQIPSRDCFDKYYNLKVLKEHYKKDTFVRVNNLIQNKCNLSVYWSTISSMDKNLNPNKIINYSIIKKDGSKVPGSLSLSYINKHIFKGVLNLRGLVDFNSIEYLNFNQLYDENTAMLIAIPEGTAFNATSYLPNNKPWLVFDSNCNLKQYYYDEIGSVSLIKDGLDNVLSRYTIKYAKQPDLNEIPQVPSSRPIILNIKNISYFDNTSIDALNLIPIVYRIEVIGQDANSVEIYHEEFNDLFVASGRQIQLNIGKANNYIVKLFVGDSKVKETSGLPSTIYNMSDTNINEYTVTYEN